MTYYTGARFHFFANVSVALARGGRYDEVGAVFGRNRPAAGFSLDLKALVAAVPSRPLQAAIRAPWGATMKDLGPGCGVFASQRRNRHACPARA
jgi:ATP phosphoribosyltransferase regulatory subunit HisZ